MSEVSGRAYPAESYRVIGKRDITDFLETCIEKSGAKLLSRSDPNRAPMFFGVQDPSTDERFGVLVYAFRCNPPPIRGRAPDEHRIQIRYGNVNQRTWRERDHPIGRDIASVDTTLVVGVHLQEQLVVGLDPFLYASLPMGISIELKEADLSRARRRGWHSWERPAMRGTQRGPRVREGLETLVALRPHRFLDYVRFERHAQLAGLDQPLRLRASQAAFPKKDALTQTKAFLDSMGISANELVSIVEARKRLKIALAGGVAEHHLEKHLSRVRHVRRVQQIDRDGEPDLRVTLQTGKVVLVECKNVSTRPFADGTPRIEVQKTRSQRGDPAGRFYRTDQFDVVAASMYPTVGEWTFLFKATRKLDRHEAWPDRIRPIQRVDDTWQATLEMALDEA
jgi:hypothetical protein